MVNENKLDPQYVLKIRNNSSLSDVAYEAIRKAIVTGSYQPGDQLKQLDLAAELDVSQRTIREALSRLVSEGLVVQKPYKGFMVVNFSLHEQREIYSIRGALEVLAMKEAVKTITDNDLIKMKELLPFTVPSEDEESVSLAREINREFHMIPVISTGQAILIRMLEQTWDLALTYYLRRDEIHSGQYISRDEDLNDHAEILAALEARDGKRASEVMFSHIEKNLASLLKRIET